MSEAVRACLPAVQLDGVFDDSTQLVEDDFLVVRPLDESTPRLLS